MTTPIDRWCSTQQALGEGRAVLLHDTRDGGDRTAVTTSTKISNSQQRRLHPTIYSCALTERHINGWPLMTSDVLWISPPL